MQAGRAVGPLSIASKSIRFIAFGDQGTWLRGSRDPQEQVAAAIADYARTHGAIDFGVVLGDNFYESGVRSVNDSRWRSDWESVYGRLKFPFYAVLGNHDYRGSALAQILYTEHSPSKSWIMPARYYSFRAGPAEFFGVDTVALVRGDPKQLDWLRSTLERSSARWKIVFGHHPFASGGSHGDDRDVRRLRQILLPMLQKHSVGLYLAGHDHNMQLLEVDSLSTVVVGSGGRSRMRGVRPVAGSTRFCAKQYGFATLEISLDAMNLRFISAEGRNLYSCLMRKGAVGASCPSDATVTSNCRTP
jgi:tartrate-resistant acid phosphatase type 5